MNTIIHLPMQYKLSARNLFFFRLILIAEKSTVYEKFPTPLINRLEKHFVLTETVLQEEWQRQVHQRLSLWVDQFSSINHINNKK